MYFQGKYSYNGVEFVAVPVPRPECDGCIFEYSVFGRDCGKITKPECVGKFRKDGRDVIFKYKEVKPKQRKNGQHKPKPAKRD